MAKPGTLPEWNTNQAGGNTVAPSAGVKSDGVQPGDKLPAQWLNWALSWLWKWAQYLDGIEGEALDWTPPQTFGEIRFGTDPGAVAYAQRIRVKCGSTIYARMFVTNEGLTFTVNASWDQGATHWASDDNAVRAFRLDMSDTAGFKVRTKSAAATWADGAWTNSLTLNTSGALVTTSDITAGGALRATTSAADGTGGAPVVPGQVMLESPVLARALIEGNGAANPTLIGGMNISGITRTAAGRYKVILQSGATNYLLCGPYSPQANTATIAQTYHGTPPTLDTFYVSLFDAAGVAYDLAVGERLLIDASGF